MLFYKFIILFILMLCNIYSKDIDKYEGKLGYLSKLSYNLKYNNSEEALVIIIKDFAQSINSKIDTVAYSNSKDIISDYKDQKIDLMALDIKKYLDNYQLIDSTTVKYFILSDAINLKLDNLYLISNNKIKNKKDLKNKKILLKEDEYLSTIFLESFFLENKISTSKISYTDKYNTLLLKTFFGDIDACVVPANVYNTLLELNPTIKSKLKILEKSPKIFNLGIITLNKTNDKESIDKLKKNINKFKISKEKEEIFTLLNSKDMNFLDKKDVNVLKDFYINYKNLKEK